jgi:PBSX family phage terminase large subunit
VEHRYRPVGSALELFKSKEPEVVLSGAAGTGKSRACLEKLHAMALRNDYLRALIVRKTAASLGSTALVTFKDHVAVEALAAGEMKFYGGSKQIAAGYIYGNGSEIIVGGIDKASRIMSSEYDVIYVQEATELTEDDWESLTTRLRNGRTSFQQIIGDCNPQAPHHWMKRRSDLGRTEMIYCRHEDNPRLYDNDQWTGEGQKYLDRLNALTGVRRERLRFGRWAAAEGLIYDTFETDVHINKAILSPPQDWPRYLSIDFGYTNPFVCQWWAEDADGRLYLYKEIYMSHRLVEDHAAVIRKNMLVAGKPDGVIRAVVCDHDAEGRATLERKLGVTTIAANKVVAEGIQAVQERMNVAADGLPRLLLCRDAVIERDKELDEARKPTSTLDEISEYVWDPRVSQATSALLREVPLKQNDHGMDAMRYLVAHIDMGKVPRIRSLTW